MEREEEVEEEEATEGEEGAAKEAEEEVGEEVAAAEEAGEEVAMEVAGEAEVAAAKEVGEEAAAMATEVAVAGEGERGVQGGRRHHTVSRTPDCNLQSLSRENKEVPESVYHMYVLAPCTHATLDRSRRRGRTQRTLVPFGNEEHELALRERVVARPSLERDHMLLVRVQVHIGRRVRRREVVRAHRQKRNVGRRRRWSQGWWRVRGKRRWRWRIVSDNDATAAAAF